MIPEDITDEMRKLNMMGLKTKGNPPDSINYPLRLEKHPDGKLEWRDDEPMTMPHLMNCEHAGEGWCLQCVKAQQEEINSLRTQLAEAFKANEQLIAYCNRLEKQLAEEREKSAVLQSQVDNADVNFEQQRLSLKQQLLSLESQNERLREALAELLGVHIDFDRPAMTAINRERFNRVEQLLKDSPSPTLDTLKKMAEALKEIINHKGEDGNGNYVCWIGETSFAICEEAFAAAKEQRLI